MLMDGKELARDIKAKIKAEIDDIKSQIEKLENKLRELRGKEN